MTLLCVSAEHWRSRCPPLRTPTPEQWHGEGRRAPGTAVPGPSRDGEGRKSGFPHPRGNRNSTNGCKSRRNQQPLPHGVQSAVLKGYSLRPSRFELHQLGTSSKPFGLRVTLSTRCPVVLRWENTEMQSVKALLLQTTFPLPSQAVTL